MQIEPVSDQICIKMHQIFVDYLSDKTVNNVQLENMSNVFVFFQENQNLISHT